MKKTICLLALFCAMAMLLAACTSLATYEENLGKDYKVRMFDVKEIDELAEEFDLDADDYGISSIMEAKDKEKGYYAYIIKCESRKMAEELVDDLDDVVELMEQYSYFDVDAVADGSFVLVGNEDVIDDALDK